MKKLAFALAVIGAVAFASDIAVAQGRGGGGGGGGSPGGSMRGGGGGSSGGGGWQGGGSGGSWRGGGSGGSWSNGGWHGGGWQGGGWQGGRWHGGGWSNSGWRGGWWGPNVGVVVGGPGFWGWGGGWGGWAPWPTAVTASFPVVTNVSTFPVASNAFEVGASGAFLPSPPQQAVNPSNFWYYCTDPAGYFPYVQNCSRAWMQVVPQNVPGAQIAPTSQ